MKRLKFFSIVIFLCLVQTYVNAQSRVITGIVRDAHGPLPGVSVQEKGIQSGAITDVNGTFRLQLRGSSNVIVIKFIGYITREMSVEGKTSVNVSLETASQDLAEVVITGFTTEKKITATGAQSAVSGNTIRENPSPNLQNTLAGRVTGFISQQRVGQPGKDGAAFLVRGQSSLNGNNSPLIIVDNIEYSYEQFSALDANEVESVTILKDASQTAVYGIKGGNGVVIVTTRRGRLGKPRISIRTDYALTQPTIMPRYLDAYNTALLRNQAEINDNTYSATPNPTFKPTWSAEALEAFRTGSNPYQYPNTDWEDVLFKDFAGQSKTSFDLGGGTEKAKYFISLSYLNQGGNIKDYSKDANEDINSTFYYKRYNFRSNLDINVSKNFTLQLDAFGSMGESNQPNIGFSSTNGNKNDIYADYGSYLALSPMAYTIKNPDGSWAYSQFQSGLTGYVTPNIVQRLTYGGYLRSNQNNINVNTTATEKLDFITKGLSVQGRIGYTNNHVASRDLTRRDAMPSYIYTPAVKDANGVVTTPESYQSAFPNVYTYPRLGLNYGPGETERRIAAQGILTYDRVFQVDHHLTLLGLYTLSSVNRRGDVTYNFVPENVITRVAKVGYDYKSKYIVNATGSISGSNRFTGRKTKGFFPAASAAYNLSEEPFFKKSASFINQLKFRAGWGIVGNDKVGSEQNFFYQQVYTQTNGLVGAYSFGESNGTLSANAGIQEGTLSNLDVTWDKERQFNLGMDYGLFNKKLTGLVEYFTYKRYDQLIVRRGVSGIGGIDLPPLNMGETARRGYELELNFRSKIGKDFNYNLRGTYSHVKSEVLYNDDPAALYPWTSFIGMPIGAEARYQYLGFFKDWDDVNNHAQSTMVQRPGDLKYADTNGDGFLDDKDRVVSDITNTPQNTFGFQIGFGFKGFTVSTLFQGATKFVIRGYEEAIRPFSANLQPIHQEAWTPERGDAAKFPALTTLRTVSDPGTPSTFWTIPGNYLRLRTAELAYNIPVRLTKKMGLEGIRLFASGNNLLTWSKAYSLYAIDPEATSNNDRQAYPPSRMYNFGLNVNF